MFPEVEVVVLDVLGTLVDRPAGLRAALRAALPTATEHDLDELTKEWLAHTKSAQEQIRHGQRPFVSGDVLEREAATFVLAQAGSGDALLIDDLSQAGWRLPAWPDSARGLARLADDFQLIGLSNASQGDLLRLNAYAGLRWHQALSTQQAQTYKPASAAYQLAIDIAGLPAERLLMVAAHAWDLRGARALGLRTAYVSRPVGDPPASGERFALHATSLDDLAEQLGASATP